MPHMGRPCGGPQTAMRSALQVCMSAVTVGPVDTLLKTIAVKLGAVLQRLRVRWPVLRQLPWGYGIVGGICIVATWAVLSARYAALLAEQATLHAQLARQAAELTALRRHDASHQADTTPGPQTFQRDSRRDLVAPTPPPVDMPQPTAVLKERAITLAQQLIALTTDWIRHERTAASAHVMAVSKRGVRTQDRDAVTHEREQAQQRQAAFLSIYHQALRSEAILLRNALRARLPETGGSHGHTIPLSTYEHPVTYGMLDDIAVDLQTMADKLR